MEATSTIVFEKRNSWRSSKTFIVTTICIATFTDGFIYGVVVPVLPFLLQSYSLVSENKLQMANSMLTAAFAISDFLSAPICAWYVDHYRSRHIPWFFGLVLIVAGNILFGVANSFTILLLSRLMQGAASAILYTVGLAVLVESVNKDEVGKYMGSAMSCNNFGIILSPLLGGVLYKAAGKMAVFGVMMGLSGIDIALRLAMQERKAQTLNRSDCRDQPSDEMACVEKGMLEKNLYSQAGTMTPESTSSFGSTTSQSNLLNGEIQKEHPAVDKNPSKDVTASTKPLHTTRFAGVLKLVHSPRLLVALYGCFINECIVASLCAVLPLFVHETFDWTSLQAGCLFLTIAIPGLAGPLAGMLGDKLGPRWVSVAGFLLTAPSLMGLQFVERNSTEQIVLLCALLTLAGSTIIFFLSPLGADLTYVADEVSEALDMDMFASSFSLMNTALAAAAVLGPLFVGWLQNEFGWRATSIALGALCLSGAVPCALYTGTRSNDTTEKN